MVGLGRLLVILGMVNFWTLPAGIGRIRLGMPIPIAAAFMAVGIIVGFLAERRGQGLPSDRLLILWSGVFLFSMFSGELSANVFGVGVTETFPESHRLSSQAGRERVIDEVAFLLLGLALSFVMREDERLQRRVFEALVFAVAIAVGIGYWGYFTGTIGTPSQHQLGYWGIQYLPATRNADALYPTVLALAMLGELYGTKAARLLSRIWRLAVLGVSSYAVLASLSRGAWLSLIGGAVAMALLSRRRWTKVAQIVVGLAVGLGGLFALDRGLFEKLLLRMELIWIDDPRSSTVERIAIYRASVSTIEQAPLGVGFGKVWAENAYLNAFVEGGVLGGLAFSVLLFVSVWRGLRAARRNELLSHTRPYVLGQAGALVALALNGILNTASGTLLFWTILAFGWAQGKQRKETAWSVRRTATARVVRVFDGDKGETGIDGRALW